jgi:hypothetical protein
MASLMRALSAPKPAGCPATPDGGELDAKRAMARLWANVIAGLVVVYSTAALSIIPSEMTRVGMFYPPKGASGLGISELASLFGLAAAMTAGITLFQDAVMRPLLGEHKKGEKARSHPRGLARRAPRAAERRGPPRARLRQRARQAGREGREARERRAALRAGQARVL